MEAILSIAILFAVFVALMLLVWALARWSVASGKKEALLSLPPIPFKPDYEADMKFLYYIIEFRLNNFSAFVLEPMRISGRLMLTDKEYQEYQERVTSEILVSISPAYKLVLEKYFAKDQVDTFIIELVYKEFTALCLKKTVRVMSTSPTVQAKKEE